MRGINKVGQDMVALVLRVLVLLVLVTSVILHAGCISSKVQRSCGGLAEEVLWQILFSAVLSLQVPRSYQTSTTFIFFSKQLLHSYLFFAGPLCAVEQMSHDWTNRSQDLIKALCKSEPSERLPLKKGGTRNLKALLGSKIVRDILGILASSSECDWLVLCIVEWLAAKASVLQELWLGSAPNIEVVAWKGVARQSSWNSVFVEGLLSAKPLVLNYGSHLCCMKRYDLRVLRPLISEGILLKPSPRQSHDQKEDGRRFGKLPHQWPKKTRGTTSRLQCQWRGRRPGTTICFRAEFPRWFYRKGWVSWSHFSGQIREILWNWSIWSERALANSIE